MLCGRSVILVHVIHGHLYVMSHIAYAYQTYGMLCKREDIWGSEVMNHLHGWIDLVAAESVYNVNC